MVVEMGVRMVEGDKRVAGRCLQLIVAQVGQLFHARRSIVHGGLQRNGGEDQTMRTTMKSASALLSSSARMTSLYHQHPPHCTCRLPLRSRASAHKNVRHGSHFDAQAGSSSMKG
jgi:hypothetical protein